MLLSRSEINLYEHRVVRYCTVEFLCIQAKEGEMSAKQLKEHFVKKVVEMAAAHQVAIQGWEDAFYNESNQLLARKSLPNTVTANAWISKWESKKAHRAHEMANADFKVCHVGPN